MTRNSLDIDKAPGDTRVVVAMSGGVDSSVTAALLKEQGYDVVGVTLQLYDQGVAAGKTGACCAGQDIADARQVAERLAIPHYVLDYESRFRAEVMDSFADSYARGETPVPCIACNRTVKFRDLLRTARELGAEALATGHYVQRADGRGRPRAASRRRSGARPELFPVRHDPRAARLPALSARPPAQERDAGARRALRPAGRRQARQPGHLLRAQRRLCLGGAEAAARGGRAGRHRRHGGPGRRPPRRHRALHRGPAPRPGAGRAARAPTTIRSMSCGSSPRRAASWSARARALGRSEIALYDRELDRAGLRRTRCRCRCGCAPARRCVPPRSSAPARVRSCASPSPRSASRPARPAWSTMPRNGSRVLGGGFIRRFAS